MTVVKAEPGYVKGYFQAVKEETVSIITKLYKLRSDPDVFQKVCQVAFATLQIIMDKVPSTANLSRLSFLLATANMHYFWNVLKIPRQILLPVEQSTIDENKVLKSLIAVLTKELAGQTVDKEDLEKFAKSILTNHLQSMVNINMAYENTDKFKELLQTSIQKAELNGANLKEISLTELNVSLRNISLLDRVIGVLWGIGDIGSVGLFLQAWNLLDTGKWAARFGRIPGFQWMNHYSLDAAVSGVCSLAYGLKVIESIRKLYDEKLTPQQQRAARWDAVNSAAEVIFNGSYFLNCTGYMQINRTYISVFAIIAKSIGIINIATKPDHVYFQKVENKSVATA